MLDRKRSYGTICGVASVPGAKFDQDGKLFNMLGEELDASGNVVGSPVAVVLTTKEAEIFKEVETSPVPPDPEPSKMRVWELAKKMDLSTAQMIERLKAMGIEVGNHMTVMEDADVEKVLAGMPKKVVIGGGGQ
jgi:hypothetical protein